MSLSPGTRIGAYEVIGKLGEGGMGEVYRARDAKLARDVALKILPDAFAHDAERLARFEREAKTLASLNHTHIAHVYGFEQAGDTRALVMELVEGEDLSDRIRRGPIPLDEALPIAKQIADALEAAHEAGIVHRDLKPANVKVRDDGTVKVLDFGLAKAFDQGSGIGDQGSGDRSHSPTITTPAMTMQGVILGTAAYMAPEQAKGKFVDKRADIWAFGCVLYEMLTGKRAFEGEDVSDTLASVLRAEPDWSTLSSKAGPRLTPIIRRCLTRDPRQRTRDIGDVRLQLEESAPALAGAVPAGPSWRVVAMAGIAAGALLAVAIPAAMRSSAPVAAHPPVLRFSVAIPEGLSLHRSNNGRLSFALSPDGQKLATVLRSTGARRRVFVRHLDDTEFREVPGTDGAISVFWAPDSDQLGFATPTGMRFTALSGGSSLAAVTLPAYGPVAWSGDRIVAFAGPNRPLHRWQVGAQPVADPALPTGVVSRGPTDWLPDGAGLLLLQVANDGASQTNNLSVLVESADRSLHHLMTLEAGGLGLASALARAGYLLVSRVERSGRSVLTAQRFDPATLSLAREQSSLATDLNPTISASQTGVLGFARLDDATEEFVWVDGRGGLLSTVLPVSGAASFDLSLDDRFVVMQGGGGLHVHDIQRGVTSKVATTGVDPLWSADGRNIAYSVIAGPDFGIHVIPAFGGAPRKVYSSPVPTYIDGWSRDGNWLAAHTNRLNDSSSTGEGILVPLAPGAKPIVFRDTTGDRVVDEARFSPDGRWLAFGLTSQETGEVFLMPLPPTGERVQVSVAGGGQPRWSDDGRSLYFLAIDGMLMMVDVDAKPGSVPRISAPRPLFQTGLSVTLGVDQFAVSRDGKRFLIRRPEERSATREEIQIIVNWPAMLKQPQSK